MAEIKLNKITIYSCRKEELEYLFLREQKEEIKELYAKLLEEVKEKPYAIEYNTVWVVKENNKYDNPIAVVYVNGLGFKQELLMDSIQLDLEYSNLIIQGICSICNYLNKKKEITNIILNNSFTELFMKNKKEVDKKFKTINNENSEASYQYKSCDVKKNILFTLLSTLSCPILLLSSLLLYQINENIGNNINYNYRLEQFSNVIGICTLIVNFIVFLILMFFPIYSIVYLSKHRKSKSFLPCLILSCVGIFINFISFILCINVVGYL